MRVAMASLDSVQGFEEARTERLYDAVTLRNGERDPGAMYMLGYAAEVTLKCAYFRLSGFTIAQPIGREELSTARARAKVLKVTADPESFHSLCFWRDLLVAHRVAAGSPLPSSVESTLRATVDVLYDRWWVEMRDKKGISSPTDLHRALVAVFWLDQHYPTLYR